MIIIIDGNIGSGKSTFLKQLGQLLTSRGYRVKEFCEPVEEWQNVGNMNLLNLFYTDQKRWAFTFQINALLGLMDIEKNAMIHSINNYICLLERSTFSLFEIFCDYLTEYTFTPAESCVIEKLKAKYSSIINSGYYKTLYVYIQTDIDTCFERIKVRARPEEVGQITLPYLESLHHLYETKIKPQNLSSPIISVDGTLDIDCKAIDEIVKHMRHFGLV